MKKGLFILIDGPSASGKDTIINQVKKDLKALKIPVFSIEETKEKNYDRQKILSARSKGDLEVAKTIAGERKKLYLEKIIPALKSGKIIIANRGETSTHCYQTLKKEINMNDTWKIHRNKNISLPDLVVITNCSVDEAIRRESLRSKSDEEKNKKYMSGKFTLQQSSSRLTITSKKMGFENRTEIHNNYDKVKDFLEKKGVKVLDLKTDDMNVPQEAESIVKFIKEAYG